jgi:hypothetical protein
MNHQIQNLGFNSWLELYEWCRENGVHMEPTVTLTWPEEDGIKRPEVKLTLMQIRSSAFEELYLALPAEKARDVVKDLLKVDEDLKPEDIRTVNNFITNLITRAHD